MKTATKTVKASQDRVKRESKAQHDRSPMLAVRVPRSLYRALKAAAKEDKRTLADYVRVKLPFWLTVKGPGMISGFEDQSNDGPLFLPATEPIDHPNLTQGHEASFERLDAMLAKRAAAEPSESEPR